MILFIIMVCFIIAIPFQPTPKRLKTVLIFSLVVCGYTLIDLYLFPSETVPVEATALENLFYYGAASAASALIIILHQCFIPPPRPVLVKDLRIVCLAAIILNIGGFLTHKYMVVHGLTDENYVLWYKLAFYGVYVYALLAMGNRKGDDRFSILGERRTGFRAGISHRH